MTRTDWPPRSLPVSLPPLQQLIQRDTLLVPTSKAISHPLARSPWVVVVIKKPLQVICCVITKTAAGAGAVLSASLRYITLWRQGYGAYTLCTQREREEFKNSFQLGRKKKKKKKKGNISIWAVKILNTRRKEDSTLEWSSASLVIIPTDIIKTGSPSLPPFLPFSRLSLKEGTTADRPPSSFKGHPARLSSARLGSIVKTMTMTVCSWSTLFSFFFFRFFF